MKLNALVAHSPTALPTAGGYALGMPQKAWLRPVRPEDVEGIHEALQESMAELSRWLAWCQPEYSLEEARRWVSSRSAAWAVGEAYDFAILDVFSGEVAGVCGLSAVSRENNFANLGYWVRTSYSRRGLATLAARRVARFGFEQLGLGRIEIVAAVGNEASQRVAQKTGAAREGVLRNRSVVGGRALDAVMFSLINSEAEALR